MNAEKTAAQIVSELGGKDNVEFLTHCVTRLRFTLKDRSKVDDEKVKAISGVVGVVDKGGQYQVIIGPEVVKVYNEVTKLGDFTSGKSNPDEPEEKKGVANVVLDTLAGIFSPIMPIIAGAGMIKALLSILTLFGWLSKEGMVYYFLNFAADAAYYFLPIFLAASASKKFKTNMMMSMLMGAMMLHPSFSALAADGASMVFVAGLPVRLATYSSSVIPIILIIWTLKYIEKFVEKIVPSVVKFILRPLLTIIIMLPIIFCVLGPLGSFLGDGLVWCLLEIEKIIPWLLPTIIGAFMPFLVMTGMHYSLLPAYVNSLSTLGYETIIGPGNLPSNIAQGAAALCTAIKTKNPEMKELGFSTGITALLGITEPALFGVNIPMKKNLIATTVGGGLGGLYAGLTGVRRFGGGGAGLAAIGLYVGENSSNVINALIAAVISFVATFVILWFLGVDPKEGPDGKNMPEKKEKESDRKDDQTVTEVVLQAPVQGTVLALNEVPDQAFASGAMGQGIAINPEDNVICAPCDGEVIAQFPTGHAVGLKAENGAEILIHIGMDTVELKGKHFNPKVKVGDHVHAGDPLVEIDREAIAKEGYSCITPIIITNMANLKTVNPVANGHVQAKDPLLQTVRS